MEGQKKTSTASKKKKLAPKKPAVKKPVVRRARKKTITTKTTVKRTSAVRLAPAISAVPLPVTVDPLLHQPLRRTQPKDRMSLRRHIVSVFSLVAISVVALSVIAGFAQVTFMNIAAMNTSMSSLMVPVAVETRTLSSMAGDLTLAMPITWSVTAEADNTVTYTHTTETESTMTITVVKNDTDNVLSWLQANQPDYTNATVVESSPTVEAWNGLTVIAKTTDSVPLQVIYLPIQKNLGERYIVILRATIPNDASELFVQQAFESVLESL